MQKELTQNKPEIFLILLFIIRKKNYGQWPHKQVWLDEWGFVRKDCEWLKEIFNGCGQWVEHVCEC